MKRIFADIFRSVGHRVISVILVLFVSLFAFQVVLAVDGDLDPTFGSGGLQFVQIAAGVRDYVNAIAVQSDGKIIIGGEVGDFFGPNNGAVLVRLNEDGSLDQTFGSGGKVIKHRSLPSSNRVANALRMSAESLSHSHSYLGARYRSLRGRLSGLKAVKAMARYLACLVYRMLTKGEQWVDRGAQHFEQKKHVRELNHLQRKARSFGLQLIPAEELMQKNQHAS